MANLHTLNVINAGVALVSGNKLGGIPSNRYPPSRTELENQLACANQDREIAIECGNRLANKCTVLDKDNKRIQRDLNRSNKDKEKLSKHTFQLIEEVKRLRVDNTNLTSQITRSRISHNEYKARYDLQLKKIKSLQIMIKILEDKLTSAQKDAFSIQKDSSKKDSEIMSIKAELEHIKSELASKIDELEQLKSDTISRSVITGGDEENKSNKSLTKYFMHKKIDTIIPAHTDNGNIHISKSPKIDNKIQPSSEICPEVGDTEISRIGDPCFEETPKGLQCNKDSTISLNETYPQISMGEVEAIPAVTYME
ncbi:hypothetical protein C2G38_2143676 [Gigaspora rosea]|uniref:Uncharacterized protein n=1 Tax=Gigaspora rosea TaxID=44941 RepID=A0A397UYC7_9GLOM|nr:hypothetical protein C2G38_2143676 [Gigaspora rosea]